MTDPPTLYTTKQLADAAGLSYKRILLLLLLLLTLGALAVRGPLGGLVRRALLHCSRHRALLS